MLPQTDVLLPSKNLMQLNTVRQLPRNMQTISTTVNKVASFVEQNKSRYFIPFRMRKMGLREEVSIPNLRYMSTTMVEMTYGHYKLCWYGHMKR